ncbi:MAG: aminopeptidase, partial [Planctomycetota bacterium]
MLRPIQLCTLAALLAAPTAAQDITVSDDPFRQLEELLPTPNVYRNASGAPGVDYWQQRADYDIQVQLDEETRRIEGSERIHYYNQSPDELTFLWVQLDNNIFGSESDAVMIGAAPDLDGMSYDRYRQMLARADFDGAIDITGVRDAFGEPLAHTIVGTMMRLDLPTPLQAGQSVSFEIDWTYVVNDDALVGGRTAAEYFEEDDNWLFEMAHWFPRMAVYSDVEGWHNKQFLGRGEFTLEFGDYRVAITVPSDHVVAATGVLQNPGDVLSPVQRERLEQARGAERPVMIITPEEALENQSAKADGTRTWVFAAEDVRDFAWASSRKFAWDAMTTEVEGREVLCMSYFPNEG